METIKETTVIKVKSLAHVTELHSEVFKALAMRERSSSRSDIDAIFRELEGHLGKELNYFKFLDVWKALESEGLGVLVHGRKGNPNRFLWKVNFKKMARKALGLQEEITPGFRFPLRAERKQEPAQPHTITFVIPDTVPKEEILALMHLGASLSKGTTK